MREAVKFLKNLAQELKDQPTDCQAAPRFWVIKDYRWVPGNPEYDNCEVTYFHDDGDITEFENVEELKNFLDLFYREDAPDNLNSSGASKLGEMLESEDTTFWELWEFVREHFEYFDECPVKREGYIKEDTMFLTKADAVNHLKHNAHHYTSDAHTYAMTAWRSPTVERLLNIIETFDWESIEEKGERV